MPRAFAISTPSVLLPLPGIPIRTTFCICAASDFVIAAMRSSAIGAPRNASQLFFACAVSIRSPFARLRPSCSACSRNSVCAGL